MTTFFTNPLFTLIAGLITGVGSIYLYELIRRVSANIKPEDPPVKIQNEFYIKVKKRIDVQATKHGASKFEEEPKKGRPEETMEEKSFYEKYANRYATYAARAYGKSDIRSLSKNAWYYVVSADCRKKMGDDHKAGLLYHFAANSFRGAQLYNRSMEYYAKSGECEFIKEVKIHDRTVFRRDFKWSRRSFMRALGVARVCGDLDIEKKMIDRLNELEIEKERYRINNPDNF